MSDTYDVVAIGSGHNGLVAAAYMAKAGKKVLVIERNDWIGGGVVTRELTLPGFKHDQHSMAHIFIQANPIWTGIYPSRDPDDFCFSGWSDPGYPYG